MHESPRQAPTPVHVERHLRKPPRAIFCATWLAFRGRKSVVFVGLRLLMGNVSM